MKTTWYIQTRGTRRQHGYRWIHVGDEDPIASHETLLDGCGGYSLNELAFEDKRTLLLFSVAAPGEEPLWTLLANGLPGGPDGDHVERRIRACVLAYARGPLPSPDMLAFTRAFLTDTLPQRLPIDYGVSHAPGFTVDAAAWTDLLQELHGTADPDPELPGVDTVNYAPNTPEQRKRAADILGHLRHAASPPAHITGRNARPLLVVSTNATPGHRDDLRPYLFLGTTMPTAGAIRLADLEGMARMRAALVKGIKSLPGRLVTGISIIAALGIVAAAIGLISR
jgi:hypothetical protein